jgi:uncharacterized Rmd1/YagE family protein
MEQLKEEKHCHNCNASSKEKPLFTCSTYDTAKKYECQDCIKKEMVKDYWNKEDSDFLSPF